MSMIGYNSSQIDELRTTVESLAQESADLVISKLKNGVVDRMADTWYAPEAVDFFNKLVEEVKRVEPAFRGEFQTFTKEAVNAIQNWMANTGAQESSGLARLANAEFEALKLDLDVSAIKSQNENKEIGIKVESARQIAESLTGLQTTLNEGLTTIAQRLDASTTFIGGSQADAAKTLLTNLIKAAGKIFNFLTEGNDSTKSLQVIINEVAEKYETVASNISSRFEGAGSEPTA